MNIIDLAVILVLGLSVLFGLYKGFIRTVSGIVSFFLAWIIALSFYPLLASGIKKNESIMKYVKYYTEDTSRLGEYIDTPITEFNEDNIKPVLKEAGIPKPLDSLLSKNVLKQSFISKDITTLGQYLNETVSNFAINIVSFLILFFLVKILCIIVLHAIDYAMKLPVLTNFNTALGGVFGFISGFLLLYIIFSILPLFFSAVPSPTIEKLVSNSFFAHLFYNANIISSLLKGT